MARGTMRAKIAVLEEGLTGHFEDHHGFLLQAMLDHIDALTAQIDALGARIEEVIAPFSEHVTQLDEITRVGTTAAQELIAEIGVDATRVPDAAHLASWGSRPDRPQLGRPQTWRQHRPGQSLAGVDRPRGDRRLGVTDRHLPR